MPVLTLEVHPEVLTHKHRWPVMSLVQVKTLRPGDGTTFPKPGDKLVVHYICRIDSKGKEPGPQIDSSYQRGLPFRFQLGVQQVIDGWDEGIARMSLGEKAMLMMPASSAYGATGAGGSIPPHADLLFEVELLHISAF
eukprot:symbB.v1.2.000932.t1/scaffold54.1/size375170/5